jgi:hypothetical protein
MTEAYRRADPQTGNIAPRAGTIGKIEIVGGKPGVFQLQIARAMRGSSKAEVVRDGPVIHYQGQGSATDNGPPYAINAFKVNVPVGEGDFLAVRARNVSFEY